MGVAEVMIALETVQTMGVPLGLFISGAAGAVCGFGSFFAAEFCYYYYGMAIPASFRMWSIFETLLFLSVNVFPAVRAYGLLPVFVPAVCDFVYYVWDLTAAARAEAAFVRRASTTIVGRKRE